MIDRANVSQEIKDAVDAYVSAELVSAQGDGTGSNILEAAELSRGRLCDLISQIVAERNTVQAQRNALLEAINNVMTNFNNSTLDPDWLSKLSMDLTSLRAAAVRVISEFTQQKAKQ